MVFVVVVVVIVVVVVVVVVVIVVAVVFVVVKVSLLQLHLVSSVKLHSSDFCKETVVVVVVVVKRAKQFQKMNVLIPSVVVVLLDHLLSFLEVLDRFMDEEKRWKKRRGRN